MRFAAALWPKRQPHALLIAGLFFAVGSTLYVDALTKGTVASVSVLGATSPFFAALLAWLLMRERTSAVALVATVVALVGVAIVVQAEMSALATGWLAAADLARLRLLFRRPERDAPAQYRDLEMIPGIALGGLLVFAVHLDFRWPARTCRPARSACCR